MKFQRTLRRVAVALLLLVAILFQGTWALAGTTGGLNGTVTDTKGAPVVGAVVIATSPSQVATVITDSHGHFSFLSLSPDTYTVTVKKANFNTASLSGVTVFADQSYTVSLVLSPELKTIATVRSVAAGNLVKPGTVSSVYSVNPASQAAQTASAGGYNLNSAFSALYNQPGVQGPIGAYGWGQTFFIRGSAYSQAGYEFDGVPVNRAFDNYNASSLSTFGQQELQVYTGGSPAGASSPTLAGFINQVIRTGTYPGFGSAKLGIGSPGFYHQLNVEAGGATPNRLFSYYIGVGGYNQLYHFTNNQDGGNISNNGVNPYAITGQSTIGVGPAGFGLSTTRGPWGQCLPSGLAPANSAFVGGTPMCVTFAPTTTGLDQVAQSSQGDRETVMNFHFGIPHKRDAGRDDVQVLFDDFSLPTLYANNLNATGNLSQINAYMAPYYYALGILNGTSTSNPISNLCVAPGALATFNAPGVNAACATGTPTVAPVGYGDGFIMAPGTTFGQSAGTASVVPYYYPSSSSNRALNAPISPTLQDSIINNGSIVKLQYQRNINERSFARVFGYTFYSDWLQGSPYGIAALDFALPLPTNLITAADYELSTHTRGLGFEYSNQINDQNLLTFHANYTTATAIRWNNFQAYQDSVLEAGPLGLNQPTNLASYNGGNAQCYNTADGSVGSCFSGSTGGTYTAPLAGFAGANPCATGALPAASPACTNGAQMIVTAPAAAGYRSNVTPAFTNFSLQDQFQPNRRLALNVGLRFEQYTYNLENTNTPQNQFWFSAAANTYCYWSGSGQPAESTPNAVTPLSPIQTTYTPVGGQAGVCYNPATGTPYTDPVQGTALHPNGAAATVAGSTFNTQVFSPVSVPSITKSALSPRIGGTYTINPDTVIRFSLGRYTQPTETAFEQYNGPAGAFLAQSLFTHFWGLGFRTPVHDNPLETSNNADLSLEKHIRGTDMNFRITPFYRLTRNQLVSVSLGGNFASGVNAATQRSSGVEVALQKGDPSRNGWSGQIAYTFTSVREKFSTLSNGSNAIAYINNYIAAFNGLTQAGGGSACYTPATATSPGTPAACSATTINNPYYSMNQQSLLSQSSYYPVYTNSPPGSVGSSYTTQNSPNQFAGFVNYRKKRFDIAIDGVLQEGARYGSPMDFIGYDPRYCQANQTAIVGSDTPGNANYQSCGNNPALASMLAVPNPLTGSFNGLGQYRDPWQLNIGANISYQFTKRVSGTLTLANLVNRCFGGNTPSGSLYTPGTINCGWASNGSYISNYYYGSSPSQASNYSGAGGSYLPWLNQPYVPVSNGLPIQAYFQLNVSL